MSEISSSDWSETDASNDANAPNGWPEGMLPSSVNDAGRAMMGALKRFWNRSNGTATSTGAANVYTASYAAAPASYVNGETFSFRAHQANTGAATFDAGPGAKAIQKAGASGPTALTGGEIQAKQRVVLVYDSGDDVFLMVSPIAYGTAAGQAVALDSSGKLPAVDGSQLTNLLPSGMMLPYGGSSAPTGWLLCDGSAVSRTTYSTLFGIVSTSYGSGDGSTTFNVPDLRGRTVIGAGTGVTAETVAASAVTVASDTITVGSNADKWITGKAVVLTTSGTAPGNLTAGSTYYVIRASATSIKLASSLANAVDNSAINITSQGSGNHTLTETLTARSLGGIGGEESHSILDGELPPIKGLSSSPTFDAVSNQSSNFSVIDAGSTQSYGGGTQRGNNMMPYGVANWIIKT